MLSQFSSPYSHNPCKCIRGAEYHKILNTPKEQRKKNEAQGISLDIGGEKKTYQEKTQRSQNVMKDYFTWGSSEQILFSYLAVLWEWKQSWE